MLRVQIQLEREDHEALKAIAHRRGVSLSRVVRDLVRREIRPEALADETERRRLFLSAAGCLRPIAGQDDVGLDHDRYLYGDPEP
jgi:hypothetical protein